MANGAESTVLKAVDKYNRVLDKFQRTYRIRVEMVGQNESMIVFDLNLWQNERVVSTVSCAVLIGRPDRSTRGQLESLCYNPKLLGREVRIGKLDSNSYEEGQGFNKFLRTVAYNIMARNMKCVFLATHAISPITLHVLTDYFGFTAGQDSLHVVERSLREIDKASDNLPLQWRDKHHKLQRQTANLERHKDEIETDDGVQAELLLDLLGEISGEYFNMVIDLTDPVRRKALEFMDHEIQQGKCPPCADRYGAGGPPRQTKNSRANRTSVKHPFQFAFGRGTPQPDNGGSKKRKVGRRKPSVKRPFQFAFGRGRRKPSVKRPFQFAFGLSKKH